MKTLRCLVVMWGAFCLLAGTAAKADFYKCTVNGVQTFSESPCGNDAKVVKSGEHQIAFGPEMSGGDIENLCALMMRTRDDTEARSSSYYGRYGWTANYYGSGGVRGEDFILSHISNLRSLARNEPDMYHYVVGLAGNNSFWTRHSSYTDDADRDAAMNECRTNISNYLNNYVSNQARRH